MDVPEAVGSTRWVLHSKLKHAISLPISCVSQHHMIYILHALYTTWHGLYVANNNNIVIAQASAIEMGIKEWFTSSLKAQWLAKQASQFSALQTLCIAHYLITRKCLPYHPIYSHNHLILTTILGNTMSIQPPGYMYIMYIVNHPSLHMIIRCNNICMYIPGFFLMNALAVATASSWPSWYRLLAKSVQLAYSENLM